MTEELFKEIFDSIEPDWKGDNCFNGMMVISKYTDNIVTAAAKGIVYSITLKEIISLKISADDVIVLRKNNWMLTDGRLSCFI